MLFNTCFWFFGSALIFISKLSFSSSKAVHFEIDGSESEFHDHLSLEITSLNLRNAHEELINVLLQNQRLVYSQPLWFERYLQFNLLNKNYKVAEILIKYGGARITEGLYEKLEMMIDEDAFDLFEAVFLSHISWPNMHDYFPELLKQALNSEKVDFIEFLVCLNHFEVHLSLDQKKKLALLFLEKRRVSSLDRFLSCQEECIKRLILRELVKHSVHPDQFFIIQRAVEAKAAFVGLDKKILLEIALIAASLGCLTTSQYLMKTGLTRKYITDYIKANPHLSNPLNEARDRGNVDIVNLYNFYLNK